MPQCIGSIVTDHVANLALKGKVQNRADVLREIRALGYTLTRIGTDYMTALDPKSGKRERLKGALFQESFTGSAWVTHLHEAIARERAPVKTPDPQKAAQAGAALQGAIRRTAAYNRQRYNHKEQHHELEHQRQPEHKGALSVTDSRWRLKNGEIIPETEFQRRAREFRELWIDGNKVDTLLSLRGELEAVVMSADQTLPSPEKEANQIRIMYRTLDKLCQYFMDWENARQRDMD